jgi:ankyrin repeat protein
MLTMLKLKQDVQIGKLLLARGADVNLPDKEGDTPLHDAVAFGREDLVSLFLEKGADVHARNADGMTPLFWICDVEKLDDAKKILAALLAKGADINAKDREGDGIEVYTDCAEAPDLLALLSDNGLRVEN